MKSQILFALRRVSVAERMEAEGIPGRVRSLLDPSDSDWIEADFSRRDHRTTDKAKFEVLGNAMLDKAPISFADSSAYEETSDRGVYPLKRAFKSTTWCPQVFCLLKNNDRVCKVSRKRNVALQADPFDTKAFRVPEIEAAEHQSSAPVDVKPLLHPVRPIGFVMNLASGIL